MKSILSCKRSKWHVYISRSSWFTHLLGASLCAMASPGDGLPVDPEGNCPVLKAWSEIDAVVARAAAHGKITVTSGKLTRQSCIDNADVLLPLVNATGSLPAFFVLACDSNILLNLWHDVTKSLKTHSTTI